MKIIVMSDSHRDRGAPAQVMAANPDAQVFIHLGDGSSDFDPPLPPAALFRLRGNCDMPGEAERIELNLEGVRLIALHGHKQGVKFGLSALSALAAKEGFALALYGHTHIPNIEWRDGVTLVCPGALCADTPTYAEIELNDGKIDAQIVTLERRGV